MVKRPSAESASDDDEPSQSTSQKRARFTSDDDDVRTIPRTKRKARAEESDEEDEEEEDGPEGDDEDEELAPEDEENLKKEYEAKRKTQGGAAEYGILERIEMHQFMCHKYLVFDFGPQINFIIGHNGSGKSAVLSAITIALGGKSLATGRGNGLKSFIREGMVSAEVTITLKNQGDEAFKPKVYGPSIVITRKWFKEGSSTWKIQTWDRKIVSQKREELSAICDHMNIQVDNPMSVLTQDSARQFLSASSPTEKYNLFLRGTQLSQLSDEYATCLENIAQTTRILEQKKEAIPELKNAARDASTRFQEAQKAIELKDKSSAIKRELAWAHVAAKQQEMTDKLEELAGLENRFPGLEQKLETARVALKEATNGVVQREQEMADLGRVDELTEQRGAISSEMKANKRKLQEFNSDLNRMTQGVDGINKQLADLEGQINNEKARMQQQTQAKHEETQRRLNDARQAVEDAKARVKELEEQLRTKSEIQENVKREGMRKESDLKGKQGEIQNCQGMIQRAQQAAKDALNPYGNNIQGVLNSIEKMQWRGAKPIGPLGIFVNAKDPEKWGPVLRYQLGQYLTAFAVTNPHDQDQLRQLLAQTNNKKVNIIIYDTDLFDYSSGELPEGFLSVLRALEISNPYVERILINRANIERVLLAPTRREAEADLRRLKGGVAWAAEGFHVRVFPEGGTASSRLNLRGGRNNSLDLLLSGRGSKDQISHFEREKQKHEQEYHALNKEVQEFKAKFNQGRKEVDAIKAELNPAGDLLRRTQNELNGIQQEANEDMPSDVKSLEAAWKEANDEKADLLRQFEDVVRQKTDIDEKQKKLLTESNELKRRIDEHNTFASTVQKKLEDAAQIRMQAQNDVTYYENKILEETNAIGIVRAASEVLQEEFATWTKKAQTIHAEIPNPRPVHVLQRQLDSVERALEARKDRGDPDPGELASVVNAAEKALHDAERDYKQMVTLTKLLKISLTERLSRWQEFRRHIALRCKGIFALHLSYRGYFGKVLFNHADSTLKLKVQTEDQAGTQQTSKQKDPRSLSGGEKSFSTICLLLALWEAIGCPLRCLDEFDVFMDAVNRRIAMKMMIDTANSSDQKQYILITPQEMGNVQIGPTVKVNRMSDPERSRAPDAVSA